MHYIRKIKIKPSYSYMKALHKCPTLPVGVDDDDSISQTAVLTSALSETMMTRLFNLKVLTDIERSVFVK